MEQNKDVPKERIASEWLAGFSGEEKEAHRAYLLNSKLLFDQLRKMLHSRQTAKQRVGISDFDSPSWSHKEAYRQGYLEAIEEISKLLP